MGKALNLTNKRFGKLVALECVGSTKHKKKIWKCKCDCGNIVNVISGNLTSNSSTSCGCTNRERVKNLKLSHNSSGTRLYRCWQEMKRRCYNEDREIFKYYGARGIKVCEDWLDFSSFQEWALSNGYNDSLTLDRIDVNGNYEPTNCRFITMLEQANNRRDNVFITYDGITHTIAEWARITGLSYSTLRYRAKHTETIDFLKGYKGKLMNS